MLLLFLLIIYIFITSCFSSCITKVRTKLQQQLLVSVIHFKQVRSSCACYSVVLCTVQPHFRVCTMAFIWSTSDKAFDPIRQFRTRSSSDFRQPRNLIIGIFRFVHRKQRIEHIYGILVHRSGRAWKLAKTQKSYSYFHSNHHSKRKLMIDFELLARGAIFMALCVFFLNLTRVKTGTYLSASIWNIDGIRSVFSKSVG